MFANKHRLTKKTDFQQVFKVGKKDFCKLFNIRYKINNLNHPRIAVVASLKVSKKAVDRNRIKRQIRAIIQLILPKFKQNYDLIINVFPPILNQKSEVIQGNLLKTLKKNRII